MPFFICFLFILKPKNQKQKKKARTECEKLRLLDESVQQEKIEHDTLNKTIGDMENELVQEQLKVRALKGLFEEFILY